MIFTCIKTNSKSILSGLLQSTLVIFTCFKMYSECILCDLLQSAHVICYCFKMNRIFRLIYCSLFW